MRTIKRSKKLNDSGLRLKINNPNLLENYTKYKKNKRTKKKKKKKKKKRKQLIITEKVNDPLKEVNDSLKKEEKENDSLKEEKENDSLKKEEEEGKGIYGKIELKKIKIDKKKDITKNDPYIKNIFIDKKLLKLDKNKKGNGIILE